MILVIRFIIVGQRVISLNELMHDTLSEIARLAHRGPYRSAASIYDGYRYACKSAHRTDPALQHYKQISYFLNYPKCYS